MSLLSERAINCDKVGAAKAICMGATDCNEAID